MANELLQPRKRILAALGFENNAARFSWSHDLGDSILFDAWYDQWEKGNNDELIRYPLRTHGDGYNIEESRTNPRLGHTRWQQHVDLVLAGTREPRAIIPVARDENDHKKGAKGWRAMVVNGSTVTDENGDIWLLAGQVTKLRTGGA